MLRTCIFFYLGWAAWAWARTVTVVVNRELGIGGGNWTRTGYDVCNGDGALYTSGIGDTLTYSFNGALD